MKNIPAPIPNGHGVYLLTHEPTRSVYVGSSTDLRNRAHEWRRKLQDKKNFPSQDHNEWTFRVVERTEGMTYNELRAKEEALIERARLSGLNVLNQNKPTTAYRFTVDNIEGSATFHATRLGKSPRIVVEKLKRGYTIEQALGREPPPACAFDQRTHAINQMPIKITHEGRPITYAEAAAFVNRAKVSVQERVKRRHGLGLTTIPLEILFPID